MVVANSVVVLAVLIGLCLILYQPRLQHSQRYQAAVMPLANIMDVGFLAMTPVIVVLMGVDAALFMLALVLAGLLMGWVMCYNIRRFEPLRGQLPLADRVAGLSRWALVGASIVNIAYYVQLLAYLLLFPFGIESEILATAVAVGVLTYIGLVGVRHGLERLDRAGRRTTAFNLASVFAILAGFLLFNLEVWHAGEWYLPDYNPPNDPDRLRKLLGFFGLVQGFEASRYLSERFDAELRCRTMIRAQLVSGVVFILLAGLSLILFVKAAPEMDPGAVLTIGELVSPILPFLILLSAIGSQVSASVNAVSNRSDLLIEASRGKIGRRQTYPVLIVPCIVLVLVTDVMTAIAVASRVFAAYYVLQCVVAMFVAIRRQSYGTTVAIAGVALLMAMIAVFGLSTDGTEAEQAIRENPHLS